MLHGVDFSGGERAGGKIWIATRAPGRPVTNERGFDHRSLAERIAASGGDGHRHLWRIDAPFALASETLASHAVPQRWEDASAWLASFATPREWRQACRAVSRREPRRRADRAARTPMAPSNLRVFKQTWTAIVRVLAPLAARGVRIEPLAGPADARVVVAEGCPASVLHLRGWPTRGYKGQGDPPRRVRERIVDHLREEGLDLPPRIAAAAIDDPEGDALDALLLVTDPVQTVIPVEALVEGWVY
ncbi:MAG: DUF429 domain-containing protein [Phycisphaerales bacterium]|nr:DUF429 domain-containing protein [Phycisphaerales bacterium]